MKKTAIRAGMACVLVCLFAVCDGGVLTPEAGPAYIDPNESQNSGEMGRTLIADSGLMLYNMPGDLQGMVAEGQVSAPPLKPGVEADPESAEQPLGRTPGAGETGTDENEDRRAKYIVKGPMLSSSKLDSGGFVDAQFIHFADPLEGEFTLRARVRITEKAGDSSSKGYFFGAFVGEGEGDQVKFANNSRGAGLLFRTNDTADNFGSGPAILPYYTNNGNGWSTGPTMTSETATRTPEYWLNLRQPGWKQERILEVTRLETDRTARDGTVKKINYVLKVYDSKSGQQLNQVPEEEDAEWLGGTPLNEADLYEKLQFGQPVYAGIVLLGTSVEISEITLWDNKEKSGTPLLQTPATKPAWVNVERLTINAYVTSGSGFNSTSVGMNDAAVGLSRTNRIVVSLLLGEDKPLKLEPVLYPRDSQGTFADELRCDWKIIKEPAVPGNIRLEPQEDGKWAKLTITGSTLASGTPGQVDAQYARIMAVTKDVTLADWTVEIVAY
jgi:hypothetical protein